PVKALVPTASKLVRLETGSGNDAILAIQTTAKATPITGILLRLASGMARAVIITAVVSRERKTVTTTARITSKVHKATGLNSWFLGAIFSSADTTSSKSPTCEDIFTTTEIAITKTKIGMRRETKSPNAESSTPPNTTNVTADSRDNTAVEPTR